MLELDFPTWFSIGCYSGLACCLCAIALNSLYTWLRRRGTTRQLAAVIVTCVISSWLLLPAILWYNMRFQVERSLLSAAEVEVALVYVALCGWCIPLSITVAYCLFTLPRDSSTSAHIARVRAQASQKRKQSAQGPMPGAPTPVQPAPFVFDEDTPWGWLEYRNGRFSGQRLALKRATIRIGRGEENDIWLDDDMASRQHGELSWNEGRISITDLSSLNGILLDGRRVRQNAIVEQGAVLEIGSHHLLFEQAEQCIAGSQEDPLAYRRNELRLSSSSLPLEFSQADNGAADGMLQVTGMPATDAEGQRAQGLLLHTALSTVPVSRLQETAEVARLARATRASSAVIEMTLAVQIGSLAGQSFTFSLSPNRPIIVSGRDYGCDVVIGDGTVSRRHAQIVRQGDGIYVQDLGSRNGTWVNDVLLVAPRRLRQGDILGFGTIHCEVGVRYGMMAVEEDVTRVKTSTDEVASAITVATADLPPITNVAEGVRMEGSTRVGTIPMSSLFEQQHTSGPGLLRLPSKPRPAR